MLDMSWQADNTDPVPQARVRFSAAGDQLAVNTGDGVTIYNSETGEVINHVAVQHFPLFDHAAHPDATVQPTRVRIALWPILRAGLLHELCGQRCEDVAKRERCATGTASRRIHVHRRLLREDETYAQLAAEVGEAAMRETYGALGMC